MASNRGRPRNKGKTGDKEDFKNTMGRYSLTGKESPSREKEREEVKEKEERKEKGLETILKEIKGTIEKQLEELRRELKEERGRNERERARERERKEWERERKEWERERKELANRISKIEEEKEREEREKRRRNIVNKGVDWKEGSNEETVKEFLSEKMRIGAEVERAHTIRVGDKDTIMVATIKSKEEKIRIMKEKNKLGKGTYIDDGLTRREREIQQKMRRAARERREKGEYVKIGNKKLTIDNKWYSWKETEERLEEERKRGQEK
jgi:hypothetical protein